MAIMGQPTPLADNVQALAAGQSKGPNFVQRVVADVAKLETEAASLWKNHQVAVVAFVCAAVGFVLGLWV